MKVAQNSRIKLHYICKSARGKILESTTGEGPVEFTVGDGQMIPGIEKAVEGMSEGETQSLVLEAAEAYGELNEDLLQEVQKSDFPEGTTFRKGMMFGSENENGEEMVLRIHKVNQETVILDANHPYAGKKLQFDIQVTEIVKP